MWSKHSYGSTGVPAWRRMCPPEGVICKPEGGSSSDLIMLLWTQCWGPTHYTYIAHKAVGVPRCIECLNPQLIRGDPLATPTALESSTGHKAILAVQMSSLKAKAITWKEFMSGLDSLDVGEQLSQGSVAMSCALHMWRSCYYQDTQRKPYLTQCTVTLSYTSRWLVPSCCVLTYAASHACV